MKKIFIVTCLICVASSSCKTAQPATSSGEASHAEAAAVNGNYILAVILKATRKPDGKAIGFEISSAVKRPGKLKNNQNDNSGNDFSVAFATERDMPLQTYYIQNPLDTWIESSEESGKLQTTPVKKNEEFISLRTNYNAEMRHLIIKKNAADSNKIILSINIQ